MIFQFELCSYPPAFFEAIYVMRPANKPALADAIWVLLPKDVVEPTGQSQYALDGGSLVNRIPWQRGTTYNDICRQYTNYVTRRYEHAIIVFDGYQLGRTIHEKMVPMNAAQVEEQAQQWISQGQQAAIHQDARSKLGTRWMRNTSVIPRVVLMS